MFGIIVMIADPFVGAAQQARAGLGRVRRRASRARVGSPDGVSSQGSAYSDLISDDFFSIFVHVVVIVAAALAILGSLDYLDQEGIQRGEYYALVLFATAGMGILAGANELVTAFVGLEMSSISTYVLAGFRRRALKSNEASLKYFLLGSFATAFFLYGIAMVYGATGTTRIDAIQAAFAQLAPADASRARDSRPGADVRRPRIQSRRRAVPDLRARTFTKARPRPSPRCSPRRPRPPRSP